MNKIIIPLFAVVLASCGDAQPETESKESISPIVQAEALRDSAIVLARNAESSSEKEQAIGLFDQAIKLDPENKQLYMGKLRMISELDDNPRIIKNLEEIHTKFPNEAFIALQLAIEYDLQQSSEVAQPLYNSSVDAFINTLDTMKNSSRVVRNSFLMNLALANALADQKADIAEVEAVMMDGELENYNIALTQIEGMDRDSLLNLRR